MDTERLYIFALLVGVFGIILILGTGIYKRYQRKNTLDKMHVFRDFDASDDTQTENNDIVDKITSPFVTDQQKTANNIEQAGFYDFKYSHLYMHFKYGTCLIIGAPLGYYLHATGTQALNILMIEIFWFIFCIIAPDKYLDSKKQSIRRKISNELPYLLDLMAICVQTGMTLEASMAYLDQEMRSFNKDLAYILKKTNDRAKVVGLATALDELYSRVPTSPVRSFVMTLKQSLQYGSSIYAVLTTLAGDIREINMLETEEKVGKLSAKMSIPLIGFIMFPMVVLIVAPAAMRALQ
jgi:tight adherence protein C